MVAGPVSAPWSDFWLDGESVVESLSLLFTTETVDGAVVVTLLVVSLATAVAINDADAVSLMTIFCTTPVFGLSSTSMLSVLLLNSIRSTDFVCCVDDIVSFCCCPVEYLCASGLSLLICNGNRSDCEYSDSLWCVNRRDLLSTRRRVN